MIKTRNLCHRTDLAAKHEDARPGRSRVPEKVRQVRPSPGAHRDPEFEPASIKLWLLAGGAFLIFVGLSTGHALTRCPWLDEGLLTDVALNVKNFGHMGSSLMDPYGFLEWPGVKQYTYWQFPLYLLALGGWLRLGPTTIVWIRLFSLLWGCIFISSWFVIVRCLSRNEALALLTCSSVALEYATIITASTGRMEMMCVALTMAALAWYFRFREAHWGWALFGGACFAAASLFCHPMGVIGSLWLAAMAALDWRQIKWGALAGAVVPYAIGLSAYFCYIRKAPDIFVAQSRAAVGYRLSGTEGMLLNIVNDLPQRYIRYQFWGYSGFDRVKLLFLIFPIIGVVGLLSRPTLRSHVLGRRLIVLAVIAYVTVSLLDNTKVAMYQIYLIPVLVACGALWVYDAWQKGSPAKYLTSSLLAVSMMATLGAVSYRIHSDRYRTLYDPAIATVRRVLPPGGIVMGGSELGFGLGFGPPLVDDRYLGYLSGKQPDVFVVDEYYAGPIGHSQRMREAWQASRRILHDGYHLVFDNEAFKIYVRNDASTLP